MNELVSELRSISPSQPPGATLAQIESLESSLDCELPDPLRQLYLDHNGDTVGPEFPLAMRLMPIDEVIESHSFVQQFGWADMGLRLFWTDDNSNYVGVHVKGPMAFRVCVIDHEEQDLSPAFRSVVSFLGALLSGAEEDLDWHVLPRDYPVVRDISANDAASDWNAAQELEP